MNEPWAISYSGKYSTIPQWYAVEQGGDLENIWIGQPHNYPTELEDIKLSDGGAVHSLRDVDQNGLNWLQSTGVWWDNQFQSMSDVGLWDDWPSGGTAMQPWYGYAFKMFQGVKAWIIP